MRLATCWPPPRRYRAIPAIGTKFHAAAELGPQSRPAVASGSYRGVVWLRFIHDD